MIHESMTPSVSLAPVSCTVLMLLVVCLSHQAAFAQSSGAKAQPSPSPDNSVSEQSDTSKEMERDPIENADEFKSKLTLGIYFTPGDRAYDLNLRHQFGPLTAWIAGFYDPNSSKLLRVGTQYDYKKAWLRLDPSLEVSTTRAMAGSLSSELGSGKTIGLAGISRTNLRPFFDLFWDPGDSVELGIAHRLSSYDRISAFTIFDVRLHTGQQNTHIVWRHKINATNGITFDVLFKSGHTDSDEYIRNVGIGVYYDRPKWFWKIYYDPHVNFTDQTMLRTGIGLKF